VTRRAVSSAMNIMFSFFGEVFRRIVFNYDEFAMARVQGKKLDGKLCSVSG
jgi:hypothetical protein